LEGPGDDASQVGVNIWLLAIVQWLAGPLCLLVLLVYVVAWEELDKQLILVLAWVWDLSATLYDW